MPTSVRTPRRLRAIAALAGVGALATVVAVAPTDPAPEPWAADGRARVPAETGTSGLTPQTTIGSHPPATIASAPLSEQVLVAASTDAIETAPAPVETADADAEAAEPDPAPPSAASVWDRVADCESGEWTGSGGVVTGSANWSATAGQFEGGLQFHPDTWDGYRDPTMPAAAYEASRPQQIAVAERVLAEQGWPAWPTCSRKLGLR